MFSDGFGRQRFKRSDRYGLNPHWLRYNSGASVRPVRERIALSSQSSVQLTDPGRVGRGLVNVDDVVGESNGESFQAPLDEIASSRKLQLWQSVKEVGAITRISVDRLGPPASGERVSNLAGAVERSYVLCVRRRDTSWTGWISVYVEPTPEYIMSASEVTCLGLV